MHELAIVKSLLEIACDHAARHQAVRISRISCRIGILRQVDRHCLKEAFQIAREGTPAETAELSVTYSGMILDCRRCGLHAELDGWRFDCPTCGASDVKLSGGDELELTSLKLEVPDEHRSPKEEPVRPQRPGGRAQPVAP